MEPLVIKTIEHAEGDYGLYTWPCAPQLAYLIHTRREFVQGKHVLESHVRSCIRHSPPTIIAGITYLHCSSVCGGFDESLKGQLGAGTAVPGITAAKVGACLTTLTDRATSLRLAAALRRTCLLNRVPESRVQILPLSWGVFSPQLLELPAQDLLLASDCFYNSADFEDILATVSFFIEKNKNCRFWTSYQERSSNRSLWALLQRWGLRCESIPLESVQESSLWVKLEGPTLSKLNSPHTLHLWEISKHY